MLTSAPSQRDVKNTRLVNALGWGDCPCILTSSEVNAFGWGHCFCILTSASNQLPRRNKYTPGQHTWLGQLSCVFTIAPSQRDVNSTRLVNARGWGNFPCILTIAPSQRNVTCVYPSAPSQLAYLRRRPCVYTQVCLVNLRIWGDVLVYTPRCA